MLRKIKSPRPFALGSHECWMGQSWGFNLALGVATEERGLGARPPFLVLTLVSPSHPPTENGAFFCNECDCRFSEEASLKRHTLQTHSDKPYKCDRCQASFRYKGNLASHKTVHTGMALPHPPELTRVPGGRMGKGSQRKQLEALALCVVRPGAGPVLAQIRGLPLSCLCSQLVCSLSSLSSF